MRIDKVTKFPGMASVKKINDVEGFFPIGSYDVSFARSIYVAVGATSDAETGLPSLGDVSVQRQSDNASAILATLFFAPGSKGVTMEIVETQGGADGQALAVTKRVVMEEARLSSYNTTPTGTSMGISYSAISITNYVVDSKGNVEKGDTVKFDLKSGTLQSGNQDVMKLA